MSELPHCVRPCANCPWRRDALPGEFPAARMVLTDNRGHHHVRYTLSKELIAAQVRQAAALHRDVILGMAGYSRSTDLRAA